MATGPLSGGCTALALPAVAPFLPSRASAKYLAAKLTRSSGCSAAADIGVLQHETQAQPHTEERKTESPQRPGRRRATPGTGGALGHAKSRV